MLKKNSIKKTFFRFWKIIVPFKFGLIISIVALIINAVSEIFMLSLLRPLLDEGFNKFNKRILITTAIMTIVSMSIKGISSFISNYFMYWVSGKVVMKMRLLLFRHIMHMSTKFFDENKTGELLSRIIYDTEQIAYSSSFSLVTFVREGTLIVGLSIMMILHSWKLSIILFFISPILLYFTKIISNSFRNISKKIQKTMGDITSVTEQMLKSHKEILLFGRQKIEKEKFKNINNTIRKQNMRMMFSTSIIDPIIQFISSIGLSTILFLSSIPYIMENLTSGTITVIFSSMISLMKPLKSFNNVNMQFQKGMTICQVLFSILDKNTEKNKGISNVKNFKGNISFQNVTFFYEKQKFPVLQKINFNILAGTKVALVGSSGSGKSTIVNLLVRLYEINNGKIFLDGINLTRYKLSYLRKKISIVSQNVHLFNDTIINNITYEKSNFSKKQIEKAINMANASEFISKTKYGLNTIIGEGGNLLSNGQKKKIAIARAFLKDAPIIIFDEATAELDSKSEYYIHKSISRLLKNRTFLTITHRINTVKKFDKILVLEKGKVIEFGNHIQLIKKQGLYAKLYNLQTGKNSKKNLL
ncbi:lipid A export permease/ATP-binding protein MsbA [bacterium endosymbiont of Pedicinus badii]|uniref:lipid A export permease/ATP-binding protein MsbA n=1 Tax=bacterium endosymbiont of Pedicinus badii TaxID=1719126 RepID=UPI0009B97CD3|nr:lipid A export permease/ATP-binding protein MsbA [bacterium endosymbiont of Pedicinus badii]OQM34348.1 lipid transporter ATP-binding/permease [bacterium endosymbiont of Pedicinus badii]